MTPIPEMTNAELADCISSARLAPAKYLDGIDMNLHGEAIREAAKRLRAQRHWCPDKDCACHHDGIHERLLPCPVPGCGAPARIYRDVSGYYFVACTECQHRQAKSEVTEFWAARVWNDAAKTGKKVEE